MKVGDFKTWGGGDFSEKCQLHLSSLNKSLSNWIDTFRENKPSYVISTINSLYHFLIPQQEIIPILCNYTKKPYNIGLIDGLPEKMTGLLSWRDFITIG